MRTAITRSKAQGAGRRYLRSAGNRFRRAELDNRRDRGGEELRARDDDPDGGIHRQESRSHQRQADRQLPGGPRRSAVGAVHRRCASWRDAKRQDVGRRPAGGDHPRLRRARQHRLAGSPDGSGKEEPRARQPRPCHGSYAVNELIKARRSHRVPRQRRRHQRGQGSSRLAHGCLHEPSEGPAGLPCPDRQDHGVRRQCQVRVRLLSRVQRRTA